MRGEGINSSEKADVVIIGAGVVGLAIASRIAGNGRQVYVLERHEKFGLETSGRSSEVIHSGIYYPPSSLKSGLCLRGNALVYELCKLYGIAHDPIGKIIVATDEDEVSRLEALFRSGVSAGVKGLKLLSAKEAKELEPDVEATAAIYSPATGIVDSFGLMKYFHDRALDKGVDIVYRSEVRGIERLGDGYRLTIYDGDGVFEFDAFVLINSAGLGSEAVAAMAGIDTGRACYRLHPCKGEYFAVAPEKSRLLRHLVYPLPEKSGTGLGIHSNIDLSGRMRLGPGSAYVSDIDYRVDASHRDFFAASVKRFLPFIEAADLEPDTSGIRPALQGPGEGFRDFVIREEADKGLPGFINLIGIESPGLTAAPAIGEMVGDMVDGIL